MTDFIDKNKVSSNILGFVISLFILSSILTTPLLLKILLYSLSMVGLALKVGIIKPIKKNFALYYPHFLFVIVCIASYFIFAQNSPLLSESPQIENIVFLLIFFIYLISWNEAYEKIMDKLVLLTFIYLIFSLPMHFFYYESSLLSATAFFSDMRYEAISNKNTLGIFLGLLLIYSLYKLNSNLILYNYLMVMLIYVSIFYTFSRSALFISILGTFLFFLLNINFFKKFMLLLFSILILLFIFQISPSKYQDMKSLSNEQVIMQNYRYIDEDKIILENDPSKTFSIQSARYQYLKESFEGFIEKPLVGHGFTNFRKNKTFLNESGEVIRNPVTHNDFAQILYELGLLGFLIFLFLIVFQINLIFKRISHLNNLGLIFMIQIIVLLISINTGNYLDHTLFWSYLALSFPQKKLAY